MEFQIEGKEQQIEMCGKEALKKEEEGFCVGTPEKAFPHKA